MRILVKAPAGVGESVDALDLVSMVAFAPAMLLARGYDVSDFGGSVFGAIGF
jgi:hypothetical protein